MRAHSMMWLTALGLVFGGAGYGRAHDDEDHDGWKKKDEWRHDHDRGKHKGWEDGHPRGKHKGWRDGHPRGKHHGWDRDRRDQREHWEHWTRDPAHQTVHDQFEQRNLQREQQQRQIFRSTEDWRQREAALDRLNNEAYQDSLQHRQYHRDNNVLPPGGYSPYGYSPYGSSPYGGYYGPSSSWSQPNRYYSPYNGGYRGWSYRGY
jgi:hypothetical protein